MSHYGTDNGPVCPRCSGSVWSYNTTDYIDDTDGLCVTDSRCVCVGCGFTEPISMRTPDDLDAAYIRRHHEQARHVRAWGI